jgi:hypothetical protein
MAVWEVRMVYQTGDRFWENVWHVNVGADSDVDAGLLAQFQSFGLDTLRDAFKLARIVRRPAGSSDAFIEILVDAVGHLAVGTGKLLPLWNVVRVLLASGAGRPGVKYLRGVLMDTSIEDEQNTIVAALVGALQGHVDDLFNAASTAGQPLAFGNPSKDAVSGEVDNTIHMRQQHRKRRKTA